MFHLYCRVSHHFIISNIPVCTTMTYDIQATSGRNLITIEKEGRARTTNSMSFVVLYKRLVRGDIVYINHAGLFACGTSDIANSGKDPR